MPGLSTTAVHGGERPQPGSGALNVPIHLSSTFLHPELSDGSKAPYIYSRYANPSVEAVERKVQALEGPRATGTLLFSSGMAAIAAACAATLGPGRGLAHQAGIYGGTASYFTGLAAWGVPLHNLGPAMTPRVPDGTRLVWMESITNPLLRVADVRAWAEAAHAAGALLAVDATFASPVLQRPLDLGADIAMHSGTKYLGGHADLLAGALSWGSAATDAGLAEAFWRARRDGGACLDPHAAYLLGRGAKTLPLRMREHCRNAAQLAQAAQEMPGVRAVHYPGLAAHPDHTVAAANLQDGCGGMLTLDLGGLAAAQAFRRALRLVAPAASLGGVESLASLPAETSHAYATPAQRAAEGIGDGLVRISVGIEDVADLEADVRQALG